MPERLFAQRYKLMGLLGKSGMSEVWSADDVELERRVALKLLAPDADRARFDREARAAASLAHPNITQLYDYGEAAGRPYMVLEYLPGGTLEDRLVAGRALDDDEAQYVAAGIAAGLAHAHDRGLVHRDLKPANILFDAEVRPKIADFGIARLDGGGTLTEAGTVLGTAAYISPEQAAGEPATPASDVYSFGVILFRMVTGRLPFDAVQPLELVALHRDTDPPRVTTIRADAPPALATLADAALAKDAAARPRDGRAVAIALGAPVTSEAAAVTQVLPRAAAAPTARPERRRTPVVVAALVVLAIGGVAAAYAVTRPDDSGTRVDTTARTPTVPTRTLPTLTTAPATSAAPTEATSTAATTHETTTHEETTEPATTIAPPPTTTAPPETAEPETTEPVPPTTTAPPSTTTVAPPTETTATLTIP